MRAFIGALRALTTCLYVSTTNRLFAFYGVNAIREFPRANDSAISAGEIETARVTILFGATLPKLIGREFVTELLRANRTKQL